MLGSFASSSLLRTAVASRASENECVHKQWQQLVQHSTIACFDLFFSKQRLSLSHRRCGVELRKKQMSEGTAAIPHSSLTACSSRVELRLLVQLRQMNCPSAHQVAIDRHCCCGSLASCMHPTDINVLLEGDTSVHAQASLNKRHKQHHRFNFNRTTIVVAIEIRPCDILRCPYKQTAMKPGLGWRFERFLCVDSFGRAQAQRSTCACF